jgi:hypothetical protein
VDVVHLFLERADAPAGATYVADDAHELEARLLELGAGVVEGRFVPAPEASPELCTGCPGAAALCIHAPVPGVATR